MNRFAAIIVFAAMLTACTGGISTSSEAEKSQYYPLDTIELNQAYAALQADPCKDNQQRFFDAMPKSGQQFMRLYGYLSRDDFDTTMYNRASQHLEALAALDAIDDTLYCRRLVRLAIGNSYNCDAPNYLQMLLHQKFCMPNPDLNGNPNTLLHVISLMPRGYQMQFWQFYWSNDPFSIGYADELELLTIITSISYPDMVPTICTAHDYFNGGVYFDDGYENPDVVFAPADCACGVE